MIHKVNKYTYLNPRKGEEGKKKEDNKWNGAGDFPLM